MKPYTYIIKHKPTGKVYYGFRAANKLKPKDDLWKRYFTSSLKIKQLIKETGIDSFEVEIRREFKTKEQAIAWEIKVLRRCKVLIDDRWINQNIAGYIIPTKESRKKISDFHKGKKKSEEHKNKISSSLKNKPKTSKVYQSKEYREKMSVLKSGTNNSMYGKKHTDETKQSIGRKNREIQLSKGNNHHMKKVIWTDERRQQMREKRLKRKNNKPNLIICPYCNRNIPDNVFTRWHGDNCKTINI